jgi:uncharacterized protein YyaL (SSP411 family)
MVSAMTDALSKPAITPVVRNSLRLVEEWVEKHDYRGYEPFDGLSSPLRPLTFGNLLLDRLLMQLIRQSPVNLRPLFGVKRLESTKGRGYMASGYLMRFRLTGDPECARKARQCLDWLMTHQSPRYAHYSWANHFDFASRAGRYSKDEPIIVWTALIGQAFLDGFELLHEQKYLDVATSVCEWISALPRQETASGSCLSYLACKDSFVHNANMLGAAMLARTGRVVGNGAYMRVAAEAMEYSCSRQLPGGSWYYGEEDHYRWIDSFHTGYNLDSLKSYIASTGDNTYRDHMSRGFRFFADNFFEADGLPKYYHDRAYPIDIQCAAQAIETLALFADCEESALPLACKVAQWTIDHMQDRRSGYFHYRRYPMTTAKTPMLHWGQATMYKALSSLMFRLDSPVERSMNGLAYVESRA